MRYSAKRIWFLLLLLLTPALAQTLLINECDADQGNPDQAEFIELFDGGSGYTSLDDLAIIISDAPDYQIISSYDLAGLETDANGYFLLSGSAIGKGYSLPDDTLPDHAAIIILYQKPVGVTAIADLTSSQILDAVVYDLDNPDDGTLLGFLETGQPQINENLYGQKTNHSIQRLANGSGGVLHTDTFFPGLPTPGKSNFSVVLINEVDASTVLEDKEFIELYDGGLGQQPLDGLVFLFYDGDTDNRYGPILDLAGYSTDENGFFLIGSSDVTGVDLVVVSDTVQNGADGMGLYAGTAADFTVKSVETEGLIDSLVYHTNDTLPPGSTLMDLLSPGQKMINEDQFEGKYIHSMQRFPDHSGGNTITQTYVLSKPTPKLSNHATPLINEIDSDQGVLDDREFIELYDQGRGLTSLTGYILVLYDGDSDSSYHTFDLSGFHTDENGFFLIGTGGISGRDITISDNFLHDGVHGIALFQLDPLAVPDGTPVMTNALEDAVIYSLDNHVDAGLAPLLMAGQSPVYEDALAQKNEHSLQRYTDGNGGPRVTDQISPALPTPGMPNSIRANKLVINELDVDNGSPDSLEFLEIYDGGGGDTSLDGLLLVLFNGVSNASYLTVDLNGYTTDENGYFVLATAAVTSEFDIQIDITLDDDTFQDGPDAAVLYLGRAEDFPNGTQIQLDFIEDAVAYDTGEADDPELLTLLNAGETQADESARGNSAIHSLQRFPNGSGGNQNTHSFTAALPTPDGPNMEGVIINEVDSDTPGTDQREFIELFDGGRGQVHLDGLVLVLYNGADDSPYLIRDLDGYSTDAQGYFVIGNSAVIPAVDLIIPDDTIQDGADAVALYNADGTDFSSRTVSTTDLLDAVVYDTDDPNDSGLLNLLNQGEEQLNENGLNNKDGHSLQRSPNGTGGPRNSGTFLPAVSTPSAPNITWSYSTRFTDLADPGNPGGTNAEADDNIEGWTEITTSQHYSNTWSSARDIGFDFSFFGKPVTEFKVSQNGLLTFSVDKELLPADQKDNIDLTTQNPFDPIIPDYTICAFWDSYTNAPPTGGNDKVYVKTFGTEPNRQLWIKWASFEYGSPNSSFNYFGIVLEETTGIVYMMDYNWHSSVPVTSTVALYANPHHFVQFTPPLPGLPDKIAFLDGNSRSADKEDNDYYEFFPTSNLVDLELNLVRTDPNPVSPINVGDRVTYVLSVTNTGDHGATDVLVNLNFSDKLTYFDHSGEGRPFDPFSGDWEVGFVPPGSTVNLTFIGDVNDSHELINAAELMELNGFDIDSVAGNHLLSEDDQVELSEIVPDSADLEVSIVGDTHIAAIGEEVVFTITLTNHGPDAGHLICLHAEVPAGLSYISDNGGGTYAAGQWDVGTLAIGAETSLEIRTEVVGHNNDGNYAIEFPAFVCIPFEYDSFLLNNTASCTVFYRRSIWQITPSSPETSVNTYIPGIQAFASVDMTPSGNYTIVWQSESGQDGDRSGVYARQFALPVTPQSGEILVNYFTANHQRYAQVGMSTPGNSVTVWQNEGQVGQQEGIYGMQFDPAGLPVLPGQYKVNLYANSSHSHPDLTVLPSGYQVIVWESAEQDGDGMGIYARLFDNANIARSNELPVATTITWNQRYPRVSCDETGNYAVTWQSWNQDGDGWGVIARLFNADGTPAGPEFTVNKISSGDQMNPDVAMSPTGEFVIVWQGPLADSQYGIFGQAFTSTGITDGSVFQVNTFNQALVASPRIDMDADGNFVVVWYSLGQDSDGAGVFGQQFRAGGMPEGYEFQVNITTTQDQSFPDVACSAQGKFVVAWQSYQQDGDDEGIFVRAFDPPCQPLRYPSVWPQMTILDLLSCVQ